MALLQPHQHLVIDRFHRAGDEGTAGFDDTAEQVAMRQQMLHFDRDVVGDTGMGRVKPLHDPQGMRGTVEEIGISE